MDDVAPEPEYFMEPPGDLHEIYMRLRQGLSKAVGFYAYYLKLLSLVDIGSQLLPPGKQKENGFDYLKEEVETILEDDDYYIQKRQMEKDGNVYRLGGDGTGLIIVRAEEITQGLQEAIEQQASSIIPKLKRLDNKIFRILVDTSVVERKRSTLEDLLIDQTMEQIQTILNKQQEHQKQQQYLQEQRERGYLDGKTDND